MLDTKNINILLVGNEGFIKNMKTLLKELGHQHFDEFGQPELAWTYLHAKRNIKPIHLVIHSLDSSQINDVSIVKEMGNSPLGKMMPMIFIANEGLSDFEEIEKSNVDVLIKPFEDDDLMTTINKSLSDSYPAGISLIESVDLRTHIVARFPSEINSDVITEFENFLSGMFKGNKEKRVLLLNFKNVFSLDFSQIRNLFQAVHKNKNSEGKLASFFLRDKVQRQIHQQGVSDKFNIFPSYKSALRSFGLKPVDPNKKKFASIDVNLVNPFISSSIDNLEKHFNIRFATNPPFKLDTDEIEFDYCAMLEIQVEESIFQVSLNFIKQDLISIIQSAQTFNNEISAEKVLEGLKTILSDINEVAGQHLRLKNYQVGKGHIKIYTNLDDIKKSFQNNFLLGVQFTHTISELCLIVSLK